jgi:hypothetical protein
MGDVLIDHQHRTPAYSLTQPQPQRASAGNKARFGSGVSGSIDIPVKPRKRPPFKNNQRGLHRPPSRAAVRPKASIAATLVALHSAFEEARHFTPYGDYKVLNILKSNSIPSLEKQLADKQAKLAHLRGQYAEIRQRVDDLGDQVSSALVDGHTNLDSLETQLLSAESRLRSTSAAIAKVENEIAQLEQQLASAIDTAAREKAAGICRDLAKELEKARPVASKAALEVAAIVGRLPTKAYWPGGVDAALKHHVTTAREFFESDFVDLAVAELRRHADEILAGRRQHDLGWSFDEQAEAYGGKVVAAKKVA